jgi:hypothetical protein
MEEEKEAEMMPGFAKGTILPDDFRLDNPFSVDGGGSSTIKSPPLPPAPVADPVAPQPLAPVPAPKAPAQIAQAMPQKALPGMPPSVTPETLKTYLDQKRGAMDKYSADKQFDIENRNLDKRRGMGFGIANAASTFADGIMQGVARAGNPGFADALNKRVEGLGADEAAIFERARKNTSDETDAKSKVDYQDPSSTMSQMYQEAFGPIFQKMGYKPESVMKMPASQIANIATLGIQYEDAQSQQELKKAMLGLQGITAKANITNQEETRKQQAAAGRVSAAKDLLTKSGNSRVFGIPIPGTSDVSSEDKDKALNVLRDQLDGGGMKTFDTEEEAEAAGLPDGTPVKIGGVEGTWKAS